MACMPAGWIVQTCITSWLELTARWEVVRRISKVDVYTILTSNPWAWIGAFRLKQKVISSNACTIYGTHRNLGHDRAYHIWHTSQSKCSIAKLLSRDRKALNMDSWSISKYKNAIISLTLRNHWILSKLLLFRQKYICWVGTSSWRIKRIKNKEE